MPELPFFHPPPLGSAIELWSEGMVKRKVPPGANRSGGAKALTVWMRWRGTEPLRPGEIVSWRSANGTPVVRFFCEQDAHRSKLAATLATDARDTPLQVSVPAMAVWEAPDHDLVLRYAGHRLEFFLDGVRVDEEWPLGSLRGGKETMQLGPEWSSTLLQVARWPRALTDDELHLLCGAAQGRAEREEQILGAVRPIGQFWQPRGFNIHVGDCMPFFHAGRFHFFFLLDRHNHQSKWGLGGHQWAHASTTDLVNWAHHPLAIALTQESEGSICTGSVFFQAGTYHAFYSVRMADGSPSPLCVATSQDGVHFAKQSPLTVLHAPYQSQAARDPVVFREEATGLFHMLVTTSLIEPTTAGHAGCLAHLVSRDLLQWEQREPFLVTGYPGEPECPDYFFWRGWYYLIFSHQGIAHYRIAREPLGPWQKPAVDTFDGPEAMVMKTAAFTGDRRIGVAFVPRARGVYAGRVIFRELIQRPDGSLIAKWPAELQPEAIGP